MKFRMPILAALALALCLSILSLSQPAFAASKQGTNASPATRTQQTTIQVQKIAVVNNAGFILNFSVGYLNANGSTSYGPTSDTYPIDQSRTIDVSTLGLATGTTIFPHVNAVAGNTVDGTRVEYAPNGQTATYTVQGTTTNYTVTLLS